MHIFYSDTYTFPLPEGHRFPVTKYALLRELLLRDGIVRSEMMHCADLVDTDTLRLAHRPEYVEGFLSGNLPYQAIRRIGLPWSPEFTRRSRASVGGTIMASEAALRDGIAGNLAGGTHHAFPDYGEGFCVFNDIAVAALKLLRDGAVQRVAVIDLDVHQGNGTAAILADDPRVFLLDIFGRHNYPFRKVPSTLDVPMENGTEDDEYLALLEHALPHVLAFEPDIIFYQAGVDILEHDSLGKLGVTFDGVMQRDRMVLEVAADYEIPIVLTLGGGYSKPIDASVHAYAGTYRTAMDIFGLAEASGVRR